MFSVTSSVTTTIITMAISISISITITITMTISIATAIAHCNPVMIAIIVTIVFRMAFYYIIPRIVTVSDNNLFVSSAPVGSVFYAIYICMQVGPGFVYDYFVPGIHVIVVIPNRKRH